MSATYPPVTPRFVSKELASVAIGATDAAATFANPDGRNYVVVVATAACFINFDAPATAVAGNSGFPLPANTPLVFYGPINAVHVIATASGGVLVAYGA